MVTSFAALFRRVKPLPNEMAITVSDYFCDIIPALRIRRKNPGARWVAWLHHLETPPSERPGNFLSNHLTYRIQRWSLRKIARHADAAWVLDSLAGDTITELLTVFGMAPEKIRRMKNGIERALIASVPEPEKTVDAIMIGVRPNKGAMDIVPVWKEVQKRRPGTTLQLAGGCSDLPALAVSLRENGLENHVRLPAASSSYLPPAEYFAQIKRAKILFAPTHEEGWGIFIAEAMACGLPVAAYGLPVFKTIYGDAIKTAPAFDTAALAENVCALLDSPESFATLREKGFARAAQYDWDAIAADDWRAVILGADGEGCG